MKAVALETNKKVVERKVIAFLSISGVTD